ncbi:MAG: 4Fe-4S dicluster domain-containing protein [Acidimicrobiia bacterium]|nr:4Fe-4S dicluster domain-containing protein [Acidimicrobiia bacterium]
MPAWRRVGVVTTVESAPASTERWTNQWKELYEEVINTGLCTGCAGCVVSCPHEVIGYKHEEGHYKPFHLETELGHDNCVHGEKGCTSCTRACPRFRTWEQDADMHLFGKTRDDNAMYGRGTPTTGERSANSGQRRRLTMLSVRSSFIAVASVSAGRAMTVPSAIMRFITSSPSSVRTTQSVQALSSPMPPVEMSACSAEKSGHILQPSRVHLWHSFRSISWYEPSFIQIWKTPLMFIFTMSSLRKPYLARKSSSKIASSNVFEHSRPMLKRNGLPVLPTLRFHITGSTDD